MSKENSLGKIFIKIIRLLVLTVVFCIVAAIILNVLSLRDKISSNTLIHPCIIVTVLFTAIVLDKFKLHDLGLYIKTKSIVFLIIGFFVGAVEVSIQYFFMNQQHHIQINENIFQNTLLNAIFLNFVVAVAEEILFRGYLITIMQKSRGKINIIITLIISSLLFTSLHVLNGNYSTLDFIAAFAAGIFLGYVFIATKDLYLCIGFHMAWNFFSEYVFKLPESGGGQYLAVLFIINTIVAMILIKDKKNKVTARSV